MIDYREDDDQDVRLRCLETGTTATQAYRYRARLRKSINRTRRFQLYRSRTQEIRQALCAPSAPDVQVVLDVRRALAALPIEYRTVVTDYFFEGLTQKEIAQNRGTSEDMPTGQSGTQKMIVRAVAALRQALSAYDPAGGEST